MKKLQIISLIALVVSLFVSIDLGLNFLYNLVPEFLDGHTSYSTLQGLFGIFGDHGWTMEKFFGAFETSLWISFLLFAENTGLVIRSVLKKK